MNIILNKLSAATPTGSRPSRVAAAASIRWIQSFWAVLLALLPSSVPLNAEPLERGWDNPPIQARVRAYWWWLNGNVTNESITRDLEEMKQKGFGGAVIIDAGGATQEGNDPVPHGPTFFSPDWRALYKHALHEADRLGLEMSLNIQSGWNLGGPPVPIEDAAKKLVWSEATVNGPAAVTEALPEPKHSKPFYRDALVVGYLIKTHRAAAPPRPLSHFAEKAVYKSLPSSAPQTAVLLEDVAGSAGEEDAEAAGVVDLTAKLDAKGVLRWDAPPGAWQVLRMGYTVSDDARVSTNSDGWSGYALDPLDAGAFTRYWDAVVEPLLGDAGPLAGRTLKYLQTDSWEIEAYNWTPSMPDEFRARRGYDLLPFLPVLAGRIVNSREQSDRFLNDFRRTLGDLAIDHHYRIYRDNAHRHQVQIHPESGGPHGVPIDAQRCLGWDDAPMSEFWAWSWKHRIGDSNRFFIKQPASAAHTYGHQLVLGEGFTTIGPNWQERISDNLKPSFDKALCEGLNLLVWHAFVCSPKEMGVPGQQYFAGTHLNPNTTWWSRSQGFIGYIDRCQWMLQQGLYVADACYYYGDHVPNFAQLRGSDPARLGPGYDYDVITEEALLTRTSVRDGRIVLPDGMSYRVLVLPDRDAISLPALEQVTRLVRAGATVIGRKPTRAESLTDFPACDAKIRHLADTLWSAPPSWAHLATTTGAGVIANQTGREALLACGVKPDFEFTGGGEKTLINYLHRRAGDTDIYFVGNLTNQPEQVSCVFRVAGKAPELWDPVSGKVGFATAYTEADGRTALPLSFPPCGSTFVVFRSPASSHPSVSKANSPSFSERQDLSGPWQVSFDPKWGGPSTVRFDTLETWNSRPEPGIRYYSGSATYRQTFDLVSSVSPSGRIWLDLGDVRELAEVRLNSRSLGIVWTSPFRVELTGALKPKGNVLEIDVVNFWPNRIIGDDFLPPDQRFTRTNIRVLNRSTPLMDSGLLGPVRVLEAKDQ